jgi:hypothetical protein
VVLLDPAWDDGCSDFSSMLGHTSGRVGELARTFLGSIWMRKGSAIAVQ